VAYRRTMKGTVETVRVTCSEVKDKKMRKRYIVTRNTGPCFWLILAPFFEKLIGERKTCTKLLEALSRQTENVCLGAPKEVFGQRTTARTEKRLRKIISRTGRHVIR